jgi:hypothetical protein
MEIQGHWYCRGTEEVGRIFESVVDLLLAKHVELLKGEKIPEIPDEVLAEASRWTQSVVIRLPNNYGAAEKDEKFLVLHIALYGRSHKGIRALSFIEMTRGFAARIDSEVTSSDTWEFEISTLRGPNVTVYSASLIKGDTAILGHAQTETMAKALYESFADDIPFICQAAFEARLNRLEKLVNDQSEEIFKDVKK